MLVGIFSFIAFIAEQLRWNVSCEKQGEWLRYNLNS
jgi:hypothetical protein